MHKINMLLAAIVGGLIVLFALLQRLVEVTAYFVEKLENRGVLYFRNRSKTSKTAAKFARPDLWALQGRDNRKLATPFGQNFHNPLYEAEIFGPEANVEFFNSICQQ